MKIPARERQQRQKRRHEEKYQQNEEFGADASADVCLHADAWPGVADASTSYKGQQELPANNEILADADAADATLKGPRHEQNGYAENGHTAPLSSDLAPGESTAPEERKARREDGDKDSRPNSALADFFRQSPEWYIRQAEHCLSKGAPEALLKPLASSVGYEVFGSNERWREVLPHIESAIKERRRV